MDLGILGVCYVYTMLMFFTHLLDEFSISFGSDENKCTRNDNAGGWALDKLERRSLQPKKFREIKIVL